MEIKLATNCDIEHWLKLVDKVKQNFPGLETQQALDAHKNVVLDFIKNKPENPWSLDRGMNGVMSQMYIFT